MKTVKILKGKHKGKTAKLINKAVNEAEVWIEGEEQPEKVPIDWIKIMGFISELLNLISRFFSRSK